MIRRAIQFLWSCAVLAFLAYLLFFVQLGERTAFGHLMRVMKTEEARELGREVGKATGRLADEIGNQVQEATRKDPANAGPAPAE